ncbi:MAG: hypothetical protein DME04_06995 [Candidatus Rokuibacteriota bacterium]|nr:MAG: hypothetical protein DME04_06995 [Candidatus Rokubacteria bacterium]
MGALRRRGRVVPDHRYQLQRLPGGGAHPGTDRPGPGASKADPGVADPVDPRRDLCRSRAPHGRGGREVGSPDAGDGGPQHSVPGDGALQDGEVTPATFAPARIQDPALRPLMKKLTVVEEPEFSRRYPGEACTRVEVTTADGRRVAAETSHPKGHYRNPLTDGEVEWKFRGLASSALGPQGCDRVLAEVASLDRASTLDALLESLVISRG